MQAWSTVPPVAGLVMSIVPLSAPMRSRRPLSPLVSDRGRAPPIPSSRTSTAHRSSWSSTHTEADVARACLTTFVRASEQKKYTLASVGHVGVDGDRQPGGEGVDGRGETALGEDGGMDPRGDLTQILDPAPGVAEGQAEQFPGALRRGCPLLLGELEVDDRGYEPLLGAVMQVPGDLLARRVGGGDQARPGGHQLVLGALALGDVAEVAGERRRSGQPGA